jgi:uncharacterized protein
MTTSLYDATVLSFLQTLGAVDGFLARGLEHCRNHDIDPQDIVTTRLHPDMLPFWFQVGSTVAHSVGALEGVRRGVFSPDKTPERDYAALQKAVAEARETLAAVSADEINGFEGSDAKFQFGERSIPFTGANFLLSFSLPNFYFHASMAYGILRARGVPLGKQDFMGKLRIKRS